MPTITPMFVRSTAAPTVHDPMATASRSGASGTAMAMSRREHRTETEGACLHERTAAASGTSTVTTGTSIATAGAGATDGPSHHTGRPTVRLETATASVPAKASNQVTMRTERQPCGSAGGTRRMS